MWIPVCVTVIVTKTLRNKPDIVGPVETGSTNRVLVRNHRWEPM
jgi:hypothetical protein